MIFSNARGTYNLSFQLGREGPLLKNEAGLVVVRDGADQALVRLQVAPPEDAADVVTKGWAEAALGAPAGAVRAISVASGAEPSVQSNTVLPVGARVLRAWVRVLTPYGPGQGMTVGTLTEPQAVVTPADVHLQQPGLYLVGLLSDPLANPSPVVVAVQGGTPSGTSIVLVEFTVPAT